MQNSSASTSADFDDEELESSSSYSGTFRWKATKVLPNLPNIPDSKEHEKFSIKLLKGWHEYFQRRGGPSLVQYALHNLAIVDCLSFSISVAFLLNQKDLFTQFDKSDKQYDVINILCIGCSAKAEERVLMQTDAFKELLYLLPSVKTIYLNFIGPEMSTKQRGAKSYKLGDRSLVCHIFQGTSCQFIRENTQCLTEATVVIGFNCGFGNFENPLPRRYDLLMSWLPDLLFLTGTKLPLFFLCANSYADLPGELAVMLHILGAKLICKPQENPFSFASTLIPPPSSSMKTNSNDVGEYSRGNSFFYGVQSYDKDKRVKLNLNDNPSNILKILLPHLQREINENVINNSFIKASLNLKEWEPINDQDSCRDIAAPANIIHKTQERVEETVQIPNSTQNKDVSDSNFTSLEQQNEPQQPQELLSQQQSQPPQQPQQQSSPLTINQKIEGIKYLEVGITSSSIPVHTLLLDLHKSGKLLCISTPSQDQKFEVQLLSKVSVAHSAFTAKCSKKLNKLTITILLSSESG